MWKKARYLTDSQFKRLYGVSLVVFAKMRAVVAEGLSGQRNRRPPLLGIEDKLLLTLSYYREYRPYFQTGKSFEVSEATAYRTVKAIESLLSADPTFQLKGRVRKEEATGEPIARVLLDATETPIERPKRGQKAHYSGKKKAYA